MIEPLRERNDVAGVAIDDPKANGHEAPPFPAGWYAWIVDARRPLGATTLVAARPRPAARGDPIATQPPMPKGQRRLDYTPIHSEPVCPICGRPSRLRATVCGGPPIQQLCQECRRRSLVKGRLSVQFCVGGCCTRAGAREALEALLAGLKAEDALERVSVVPVDCMDLCDDGPVCRLLPDRRTYRRVSPSWAERLGKDLAHDRRARK